jgi:hypothetical protein
MALVFLIEDHAFNRDKNYYSLGFKGDKLVSIVPLPANMQEDQGGLVDRYLRNSVFVH